MAWVKSYRLKTVLPPTIVRTILASRISGAGIVRRSRSITVRSASMPGAIVPSVPLLERRVRGASGVRRQRLLDRDLLLRHPAVRVLVVERAPRHGRVDAFERRRRRDEPVAAERQPRARSRAAIGTHTSSLLRTGPITRSGPSSVVDRVIRLHARDDAERAESRNVRRARGAARARCGSGGRAGRSREPRARRCRAASRWPDRRSRARATCRPGLVGAGDPARRDPRACLTKRPRSRGRVGERLVKGRRVRSERAVDESLERADPQPGVAAAVRP